jgi:glycosyltransferase involved in cell wall biosynthesis
MINRSLTLCDLPDPPSGKVGFPWTEQTESITNCSASDLPRISIVTGSYNQGKFIEETIRSILLQGYPNLEYIIIDGGSTDNTTEIIQKYSPYLAYWVSEPDRGQSHAINKGLSKISGQIWAYMNSDDRYEKYTFQAVAHQFQKNKNLFWVTGHAEYINEIGNSLEVLIPQPFQGMKETLVRWEGPRAVAIQVSNFMSKLVLERYGLFDETLHYCMDAEFGMRLLVDDITPIILPTVLAKARLHSSSKTVTQSSLGAFIEEDLQIARQFLPKLDQAERNYVEQKIAECRFFVELGKVAYFQQTGNLGKFSLKMLQMLIRNPSYLFYRATWGLLRQALAPKITEA